jgi:hypothetical protein
MSTRVQLQGRDCKSEHSGTHARPSWVRKQNVESVQKKKRLPELALYYKCTGKRNRDHPRKRGKTHSFMRVDGTEFISLGI